MEVIQKVAIIPMCITIHLHNKLHDKRDLGSSLTMRVSTIYVINGPHTTLIQDMYIYLKEMLLRAIVIEGFKIMEIPVG